MSSNHTALPWSAAKHRSRFGLEWFFGLALLGAVIAVSHARAQEVDDQYLPVFYLIQQADSMKTNGQTGAALAKYQQAQTNLMSLQKSHPDWNVKLVAYRLSYLTERIGSFAEKAPREGGTAAEAKVKL